MVFNMAIDSFGRFVKGSVPHNKRDFVSCRVHGCERTDHKAYGYCGLHYRKMLHRKQHGHSYDDIALSKRAPRTAEHVRNNLSYISAPDYVSPLKGKTYQEIYGDRYEERIKRHSESLKGKGTGRASWNRGKKMSDKTKKKLSKILKGKLSGIKNPMFGKCGELAPNWKGGKSFEPYSPLFNRNLKLEIKTRDKFCCVECGSSNRRLHVHHIDYNKMNNVSNNLITLCVPCHAKTNFGREDWIKYFNNKNGVSI